MDRSLIESTNKSTFRNHGVASPLESPIINLSVTRETEKDSPSTKNSQYQTIDNIILSQKVVYSKNRKRMNNIYTKGLSDMKNDQII